MSAEVVLCMHNTTTSASLDYCHKLTNPYLHQFSSISGGNCISIKLLIGVMHWVQDQDRCYGNASTGDIADANEFREIIDISIQRATLQEVEDDQVDMISKI